VIEVIRTQLERQFPKPLVSRLIRHYGTVKSNYLHRHLEPRELNCAKFAEVVFRMIQYETDPTHYYTPLSQSLPSVDTLITQFQNLSPHFDDSLRLHIPRVLKSVYGVRNKRGVGHTGIIDANLMDATLLVSVCDWVMAELVRLYHDCLPDEAQQIVDSLVKRSVPIVYDKDGVKTLLKEIPYDEGTLLLLYNEGEKDVPLSDLFKWVGHTNITNFRRRILGNYIKRKKYT